MADVSKINGFNIKDKTARNDILTLKSRAETLENRTALLSNWSGKSFVAFGTSITSRCDDSAFNYAGGYLATIKELCGFSSYTNKAVSGAAMANDTRNGNGINHAIKNYNITEDCILIETCANDWQLDVPLGTVLSNSTKTYAGALKDALNHLLTNYPEKPIFLITRTKRDNWNDVWSMNHINNVGHKLVDYVNMTIAIGNEYAIPVCDIFRNSCFNIKNIASYTEDGTHPNAKGYTVIGKYISSVILNGFSGSVCDLKEHSTSLLIGDTIYDISCGKTEEFKLVMQINGTNYMFHSHCPLFLHLDGDNCYEVLNTACTVRATADAQTKIFNSGDGLWELSAMTQMDDIYHRVNSPRSLSSFIMANYDVKLWGTDTVLIKKSFD